MKILQGIDLLKTERIQKVYEMFGDKFLYKIFSINEIEQIKKKKQKIKKIASKFSAKEATSKAIGTGFSEGLRFKDIEILNQKNGKPVVKLNGKAKQKINNVISSSVSISDEKDLVITIVTFIVKN
ncbi:MAG: holo-[acyl-carrier-protein] synthase [Alphaproteobacteria bacterium]|nr:holo-[acyl-carrier-protein] synthase [Alphaproteobacteria bacterium]|tara:strand:- start:79 stop:456 length:378 start_codon:yes stop_codon:yes gene_type:complete